MVPKVLIISARHSALAPQSSSRNGCLSVGICAASAGRLMPLSVRTIRLVATCSAPVDPAETKASASPFLSMVKPRIMLESFFWRAALTGSSSIVMTSGQSMSSNGARSMESSAAAFFRVSAGPSRAMVMPWPNSCAACAAPCSTAFGALSPPMASSKIFMLYLPHKSHNNENEERRHNRPDAPKFLILNHASSPAQAAMAACAVWDSAR